MLINFEEALLCNRWSISVDQERSAAFELATAGASDGLRDVSAVWMRRWGFPAYPKSFDEYSAAFAFNEISSVVATLPSLLKSAKWINDQSNERAASNKVLQLELARRLGLLIPPTLITTDEKKVREFKNAFGRIIFKPVSAYQLPFRKSNVAAQKLNSATEELGFGRPAENLIIFTQELTEDKLEQLGSIRWAPVIFQQRIEKEADIRVTVVGNRLFSCRIDSQGDPHTVTDFRIMNLTGMLPHSVTDIPRTLTKKILKFMKELGLLYGCFDFVLTKDGEYYFLEVNPAGQWLWIEQLTGLPISEAIASELRSPG